MNKCNEYELNEHVKWHINEHHEIIRGYKCCLRLLAGCVVQENGIVLTICTVLHYYGVCMCMPNVIVLK